MSTEFCEEARSEFCFRGSGIQIYQCTCFIGKSLEPGNSHRARTSRTLAYSSDIFQKFIFNESNQGIRQDCVKYRCSDVISHHAPVRSAVKDATTILMMTRTSSLLALLLWCFPAVIHAWTPPIRSASKDSAVTVSRRAVLPILVGAPPLVITSSQARAYSGATIDVNNAMAREFTAFPGYARNKFIGLLSTLRYIIPHNITTVYS